MSLHDWATTGDIGGSSPPPAGGTWRLGRDPRPREGGAPRAMRWEEGAVAGVPPPSPAARVSPVQTSPGEPSGASRARETGDDEAAATSPAAPLAPSAAPLTLAARRSSVSGPRCTSSSTKLLLIPDGEHDSEEDSGEDVEAPCLGSAKAHVYPAHTTWELQPQEASCPRGHRTWLVRAPYATLLACLAVLAIWSGPQRWFRARWDSGEPLQVKAAASISTAAPLTTTATTPAPRFQKIQSGNCVGKGLFPITDPTLCQAAARELVLPDFKAQATTELLRPQGCYWHAAPGYGGTVDGLWFNLNKGSVGKGTESSDQQEKRLPICTASETCGMIIPGVEYVGSRFASVSNMDTGGLCCEKCQANWRCAGWTLDTTQKLCYLLEHTTDFSPPVQVNKAGSISGLPYRNAGAGVLYCVALMQPGSYEVHLLQMQYHLKVSMFSCDEYAIYSNAVIEVAPGLRTATIDSDLKCSMGGDAGTALNTGIFIAFWKKIIADGRFRFNLWTVKVDPDAVFFPDRLRGLLTTHTDGDKGVYLNNCKFGLHGPIEVFSRKALQSYADEYRHCEKKLWFASTHWGEDMFMDQCLLKVVKVKRDDAFNLICEDHCGCPSFSACNTGAVVFHPFKTQDAYRQCMLSAGAVLPL